MSRSEEALPEFKVWKTIRLGVYKDTDAYRKALKKKGINISRWADDTLGKIDVAAVEREIDVVKIYSGQLGFTTAARRDTIYGRAFSIGFEPCMPEIGPLLREEYMDQPVGEWIIVGMDQFLARTRSATRRCLLSSGMTTGCCGSIVFGSFLAICGVPRAGGSSPFRASVTRDFAALPQRKLSENRDERAHPTSIRHTRFVRPPHRI